MQERIEYIDRIKGFAILLVVLGHFYLFLLHTSDTFVYRFISSCHMHLFMFISGFVAFIPDERLTPENKRRLLKRFLAYLCPNISIPLLLIAYHALVGKSDMVDTWEQHYGFWYLKCLALYCLIQYLLLRFHKVTAQILIVCIAYVLFYLGWQTCPTLNNWLNLEHSVCFFPFYLLGYCSKKYHLTDTLKRHNWIFTIALLGYTFLLYIQIPIHSISIVSERFIVPTCATIAIYYLFMKRSNKQSAIETWLSTLGSKTLDIYMYHGFFIMNLGFLNMTFLSDWVRETGNPLLCFFVALTLSISLIYISIGTGYIIKQSDLLRKLIYGQFLR